MQANLHNKNRKRNKNVHIKHMETKSDNAKEKTRETYKKKGKQKKKT